LGNYCDLIEPQLHSNWGLIATPPFVKKSLVVDYQQVINPLIFAIFATTGNLARVEANFHVNFFHTPNVPFVLFSLKLFFSHKNQKSHRNKQNS
jgi:hypothetical protein